MGEARAESGCNICCGFYNGCIMWTKISRCFCSGRSVGSKSALFGVGWVFVACRFTIGTNTHCALEGVSALELITRKDIG